MKYVLETINILPSGSVSVKYRKLTDEGKYIDSIETTNLSYEVRKEIYNTARKIENFLNA